MRLPADSYRARLCAAPTRAELALANALKGDTEVERNYPVVGYFVDFAWPSVRLAVEIDGAVHRRDAAWMRDVQRQERLERAGWHVIRFDNEVVLDTPYAVVFEIRRALDLLRGRP